MQPANPPSSWREHALYFAAWAAIGPALAVVLVWWRHGGPGHLGRRRLDHLLRDDLGLEAVKSQIKTVFIANGASFTLSLSGGTLSAVAPLAEHPRRWVEQTEAVSRLEALL